MDNPHAHAETGALYQASILGSTESRHESRVSSHTIRTIRSERIIEEASKGPHDSRHSKQSGHEGSGKNNNQTHTQGKHTVFLTVVAFPDRYELLFAHVKSRKRVRDDCRRTRNARKLGRGQQRKASKHSRGKHAVSFTEGGFFACPCESLKMCRISFLSSLRRLSSSRASLLAALSCSSLLMAFFARGSIALCLGRPHVCLISRWAVALHGGPRGHKAATAPTVKKIYSTDSYHSRDHNFGQRRAAVGHARTNSTMNALLLYGYQCSCQCTSNKRCEMQLWDRDKQAC